jgi:uncharacterized protein YkwD
VFVAPLRRGPALLLSTVAVALAAPAAASAQLPVGTPALPGTPSVPSVPTAGCGGATAMPGSISAAAVRGAVLCLLNQQRAAAGLPALRARKVLGAVARRYARSMVTGHFFDHTSPSGSTVRSRVARTSYLRGASSWALGENIAYGGGDKGTAAAIVAAWMGSAGHRANILNGGFRDIGIGVAGGLPVGGSGATYVTDFGRRG